MNALDDAIATLPALPRSRGRGVGRATLVRALVHQRPIRMFGSGRFRVAVAAAVKTCERETAWI